MKVNIRQEVWEEIGKGETQGISLLGLMTNLSYHPIAIDCNRKQKVIKKDDQSEDHVEYSDRK